MSSAAIAKLQPALSQLDRLGYTLFVATALHGFAILALDFEMPFSAKPAPTLEITLVSSASQAPAEADFLAQHDQLGSGELEQPRLLSSTLATPAEQHSEMNLDSATISVVAEQSAEDQAQQQQSSAEIITTRALNEQRIEDGEQQLESELSQSQQQLSSSQQHALLLARIDQTQQLLASAPRRKTLTALSTKSHEDARYLDNWRRRIEDIGNLNYPVDARRQQLFGSLQLLVVILPDGTLKEIEVIKSSGHAVLDSAAVDIVRMAAPFEPFPQHMRKSTDLLEIIRTWKFEKSTRIY